MASFGDFLSFLTNGQPPINVPANAPSALTSCPSISKPVAPALSPNTTKKA